jgi:hypothetical protein
MNAGTRLYKTNTINFYRLGAARGIAIVSYLILTYFLFMTHFKQSVCVRVRSL